jgi:hypothetical protein
MAVNPGKDLYKQIPALIEAYNNSPHTNLGDLTPQEALSRLQGVPKRKTSKPAPVSLEIGDSVRIVARHEKNPYNKIRPNWSREIYTIEQIQGQRLFLSNGKSYREHEVFHVPFPEKVEPRSASAQPQAPESAPQEEPRSASAQPKKKKEHRHSERQSLAPLRRSRKRQRKPNQFLLDFV